MVSKSCRAGDELYINSTLDAVQIRISFKSLKPVKLNDMQFSRAHYMYMSDDNRSNYGHSTNFICETDFIAVQKNTKSYHRVVTCIRAYKKMSGLYDSDSLLMIMHVASERCAARHQLAYQRLCCVKKHG